MSSGTAAVINRADTAAGVFAAVFIADRFCIFGRKIQILRHLFGVEYLVEFFSGEESELDTGFL